MARNEKHARARRLTVVAAFAGAPLLLLRLPEPDPTDLSAPRPDPCAPALDETDPTASTTTTTTTTTTTLPDGSTSVPDSVPCPEPTDPAPTDPATPVPPDSTVPDSTVPGLPETPDSSVPDGAAPPSDAPSTAVPDSTDSTGAELAPGDGSTAPAPPDSASTTESVAPDASTTTPTTSAPAPPPTLVPSVDEPELPEPPPAGWPVREITFPVAGPVTYYDDWGACRGGAGCPRHHIGNDIIGMRLQPLLAAVDGTVTHLVLDHPTAGWGLVITDADGWDYRYYHVNNDAPGTDDGSDPAEWRWAPGIAEGSAVRAGQVVAYIGDSGNSETSVPHLHFEIHQPDGQAISPYASLRAAEAAQRCQPPLANTDETLLPVPPPANASVEVRTRTGKGAFHLGPDGTTWLTGDALTVGWERHAAEDPPCAPAPVAPTAIDPASLAVPWDPASTVPPVPSR